MSEDGIDRAALARHHALGGQEFVAELLKLALQNIAEQLARGHEAAVQNDAEGVAIALHSIAGSAGNIGAVDVENLARHGLAQGKDYDGAKRLDELARLEAAFTRARPLLLEANRGRD